MRVRPTSRPHWRTCRFDANDWARAPPLVRQCGLHQFLYAGYAGSLDSTGRRVGAVIFSERLESLLECDEVWCTATSEAWDEVNALGRTLTEAGKRFLVGGHHATALPQTLRYGEAFRGPVEGAMPLDKLPLPCWDIFPESKRPIVITSRGCPYACHFCSSRAFWKRYQARSADAVLAELRELARRVRQGGRGV